jgi:predicted ATP-dependent endonuclease of OLD family
VNSAFQIELRNYRCFADSSPAVLGIRPGFTALLGPNNSGKSSLLRFFFEFRDLFTRVRTDSSLLNALLGGAGFNYPSSVADPEEVFCNTNEREMEIRVRLLEPAQGTLTHPTVDELRLFVGRSSASFRAEARVAGSLLPVRAFVQGTIATDAAGNHLGDLSEMDEAIAILRDTLYIGPFRNAINIGSDEAYYDMKTGQAFIKEWRRLKTGTVKREKEAAHQLTENIRSLFGFASLEINSSLDEQTLEVLVNGRSYRLAELGAGIAQFILTLATAATRRPRPTIILIDEPETSLHPTLQLDFLTTLGSSATYGTVFATHVMGLARSSSEFVYTTTRSPSSPNGSLAPYEKTTALAALLGELSYSGYQALGFERVLIVEGITDVKTVQQFLRLYRKEHKVLIVPAGGSELFSTGYQDQLLEVKARLSRKVSVLLDSERASIGAKLEAKRANFAMACKANKIDYHVLDRRAIENYLTQPALDAALGVGYLALGPFEKLARVAKPWPKEQNWQVARAMKRSEIASTDLGKFLGSI